MQDVIELRENKWQPRNKTAAPITFSQIRDQARPARRSRYSCAGTDYSSQATKEKAAAVNRATWARTNIMISGGSRRVEDRSEGSVIGPDGWPIASSGSGVRRRHLRQATSRSSALSTSSNR